MSDWLRGCLVAAVGLATVGCGGYQPKEGVVVKGIILKGAQPLQVPRRDIGLGSVEVQLVPTGPSAANVGLETALADEKGTFEFLGAGRGVMPGKYKLAVYQHDNGLASDGLKGAFSAANTRIEVEIPEDNVGGTQDLGVLELNDQVKR